MNVSASMARTHVSIPHVPPSHHHHPTPGPRRSAGAAAEQAAVSRQLPLEMLTEEGEVRLPFSREGVKVGATLHAKDCALRTDCFSKETRNTLGLYLGYRSAAACLGCCLGNFSPSICERILLSPSGQL